MKTDARVRYTKMRIREAFMECLGKKQISRITVKEICDMAEINRATFYKHYADPFELLQKIEEEELDRIQQKIERAHSEMPEGVLLTVVKGMKAAENPYALLASSNGDPGFATRISELFYRAYRPRMAQDLPSCTEAEKDMAYLFISGGCGQLISAWIREGMQTAPEEVADRLETICRAFLKSYNQIK